jgi:hypothetical protein
VAEDILHIAERHLLYLESTLPKSIAVSWREKGGFPSISFLRKDAEDTLITCLVDQVCKGRTSIIPTNCTPAELRAIKEYISEGKVTPKVDLIVRNIFPEKPAVKQTF